MKDYTINESANGLGGNTPVSFRVEESAQETVAAYFRDLSRNYHDYITGAVPWPQRPEGLIVVKPDTFEEENPE